MSFYETLYIVDPNLENKALEKTMDSIGKELETTKSKIINHHFWGKKRLAYPIDRQKYGSYIIMQYEGCLLYTSPSPRDRQKSRMPSSA